MDIEGKITTREEDGSKVELITKFPGDHSFDVTAQQLLIEILTTLQKIEYHLMIATGADLSDRDVGD